ncbi:MAG: phage head closure protein [Pseudorhodoplanes sp.]|jgi:SPP1 family predicted phage head-tail adaptor|nr:phage head closure protein [Pseudorhodoplanes sp.]
MSDPGALNRRLALEAPVETPDGAGGVTRTYESVAILWAAVTPVSAREEIAAAQRGVAITHRITLRYSADITPRHRLRDGARLFRIVTLRDRNGRKRFLEIQAEERGA